VRKSIAQIYLPKQIRHYLFDYRIKTACRSGIFRITCICIHDTIFRFKSFHLFYNPLFWPLFWSFLLFLLNLLYTTQRIVALSVLLLLFTASDYPSGIFKLFIIFGIFHFCVHFSKFSNLTGYFYIL